MKKWNEVVVDLRPFLEDLENDPNDVISAFVYSDASGKPVAEKLRTEFKDKFGGPGDKGVLGLQWVDLVGMMCIICTWIPWDKTRQIFVEI